MPRRGCAPKAPRPRRRDRKGANVAEQLLTDLTIFILAIFIGYETISKVPVILHTPLMSGTNAIHGIVLVGAMLVAGTPEGPFVTALAFLAVVLGTINVVGGFLVTDRMLQMFAGRPKGAKPGAGTAKASSTAPGTR